MPHTNTFLFSFPANKYYQFFAFTWNFDSIFDFPLMLLNI